VRTSTAASDSQRGRSSSENLCHPLPGVPRSFGVHGGRFVAWLTTAQACSAIAVLTRFGGMPLFAGSSRRSVDKRLELLRSWIGLLETEFAQIGGWERRDRGEAEIVMVVTDQRVLWSYVQGPKDLVLDIAFKDVVAFLGSEGEAGLVLEADASRYAEFLGQTTLTVFRLEGNSSAVEIVRYVEAHIPAAARDRIPDVTGSGVHERHGSLVRPDSRATISWTPGGALPAPPLVGRTEQQSGTSMGPWVEQWDRVELGLARIQDIYDGRAEPEGTKGAYYDVYSFFLHCFHLWDWIKNDAQVAEPIRNEARRLINGSTELKVCADLANRSKHSSLRDSWTGDVETGPRGNDVTVMVGRGASHTFRVSSGGAEWDALDLAKSCVEIWRELLVEYKLL
jgi:hypothetical protein